MAYHLNQADAAHFHRDGYVLVRNFFSIEEINKLYSIAVGDRVMQQHATQVTDKAGKQTKLTLWYTPGEDVYSLLLRSDRMVKGAALLLDSNSPVCHFHTKLMQKEPGVGGAWEWHQDYGYWYKNQFLFPDQLVSCMVALTSAHRANGCLQVIKGSHKMGRVNHGFAGEQVGADMEMVNNALTTLPHEYIELEPGDALFFHSNLLHRSEANTSDQARWTIISCYNSLSNPAFNDTTVSRTRPIITVPDEALLLSDASAASETGDFLRKENDPALQATGWEQEVKTNG